MLRHVTVAAICALALVGVATTAILAHAELESASPGPDEVVVGAPSELVARFSQDLDPSRTSLEVRDASGVSLARGGAIGDGPREFRLPLPQLAPGVYEVRWTSFSAEDDELERDTYHFTIAATQSPTPTVQASPTSSASPSSTPPASQAPSPTATPITSLLPSPTATVVPAPTDLPDGEVPAAGLDLTTAIPVFGALLLVLGLGVWFIRQRSR